MHTSNPIISYLKQDLEKRSAVGLPLYRALYEALRGQILEGWLLPDTRLPSSRLLSTGLGLGRNTVITAIEQLCIEGYAESRPKSGVYVLTTQANQFECVEPKHVAPLHISERGKNMAQLADYPSTKRGAFAVGIPDLSQFPYKLWQKYIARQIANPKLDGQINSRSGGDNELRQILADYLRLTRSIQCKAENVLITRGTQFSLQLIADILANRGDLVWLENPGYRGAFCAFDAAGLQIVPQPLDKKGMLPADAAWQKPPRFIYVTPSHQFPTGVVMDAQRRCQLVALAAQHQTWIIEDDYDSEFCYEGAPIAALQALAPQQVIYMGTLSKVLFPAIQIGYLVLPEHVVDAFRIVQARHLREPPYFLQKALADFIRDGHFSAHVRQMRHEYQKRRDYLCELLQQELSTAIQIEGLSAGLHVVLYLPAYFNEQEIVKAALQQGMVMSGLSDYSFDEHTSCQPALVLGFGNSSLQDIKIAAKQLARIIKNNSSRLA